MALTVTIDSREVLEALGQLRSAMVDIGGTLVSLIHEKLGRGVTP